MNKYFLMTVVSVTLCSSALCAAEGEATIFDGKWRISAGAVYNSPAKMKFHFQPVNLRPMSQGAAADGLSQAEAEERAKNGVFKDGKVTYANGAWFADDVTGGSKTWNGNIPAGSYMGDGRFSLGSVAYEEGANGYTPSGIPTLSDSHDAGMPGVNVELSRELYRDDDNRFGLDLAFGVSYFLRKNAFRSSRAYQAGTEDSAPGGRVYSSIKAPDELPDPDDWYWNDDGSYGRGGIDIEDNGGPVFDRDTIETETIPDGATAGSTPQYGGLRVRGDYRQLEMMLAARPYYDVTDWLRINGTLGVAVSHDQLKIKGGLFEPGYASYWRSNSSQWDVYGIGGLGVMLRYDDFTLSGDFLARFLDSDLQVDDRYTHGTVEHGRWMFKVALGYEF